MLHSLYKKELFAIRYFSIISWRNPFDRGSKSFIIRRIHIMGEEGLTDKQYASILLDEIAELEEQINVALEEGAVRTVAKLTEAKKRKEEKLQIILGKR